MEELQLKMDAVMLGHIETYLSHPQTISSYCRTHSIKEHVFHYWYGKYKSLQKGSSSKKGFVEVALVATSPVQVHLNSPNGCVCHFTHLPPADYLRQLLSL
jgi:hypothetical protein